MTSWISPIIVIIFLVAAGISPGWTSPTTRSTTSTTTTTIRPQTTKSTTSSTTQSTAPNTKNTFQDMVSFEGCFVDKLEACSLLAGDYFFCSIPDNYDNCCLSCQSAMHDGGIDLGNMGLFTK